MLVLGTACAALAELVTYLAYWIAGAEWSTSRIVVSCVVGVVAFCLGAYIEIAARGAAVDRFVAGGRPPGPGSPFDPD